MQRKVKIWSKILFIVLVAVLPTGVITLYTAHVYQQNAVREAKNSLIRQCEGFTNEQRLIVNNARQMMIAVSQTRSVQSGNYIQLDNYLQTLMQLYEDYVTILLADETGTVVASGVHITGYTVADRPYFKQAQTTGEFTIGDFIFSRSTGKASLPFCLPLVDTTGTKKYLISSYDLGRYGHAFSATSLPEEVELEIFGLEGLRLFSVLNGVGGDSGLPVAPELITWVSGHAHHAIDEIKINGIDYLVSYGMVSDGEQTLYVTVRTPRDQVVALAVTSGIRTVVVMLLACLLAVALSLYLARRLLVERIEKLTSYTKALAAGDLSVRSDVNQARDEITDLIDSFNEMAAALEARNNVNRVMLNEKESLLQELQKRVADNLQILSSMVNLQIEHGPSEAVRQALVTAHSRIMALSLVYETIYRFSDVQKVMLHRYCNGLCDYLLALYADVGSDITYMVTGVDAVLSLNQAIPIGLILNELVSNSLVHAFPNGRSGIIQILFVPDSPGLLEMRIIDNGVGFPGDVHHTDTLGYEMTLALVDQIQGKLTVKSGPEGSFVSVQFPVDINALLQDGNSQGY